MARPCRNRVVETEPRATVYKPAGIPARDLEWTLLRLDEWEALRLADGEGLDQAEAAERMGVSRATLGRILEAARHKVAQALTTGQALSIEGGPVTMKKREFKCHDCGDSFTKPYGGGPPEACPHCGGDNFERTDAECRHRHGRGSHRPGSHGHGSKCRGNAQTRQSADRHATVEKAKPEV